MGGVAIVMSTEAVSAARNRCRFLEREGKLVSAAKHLDPLCVAASSARNILMDCENYHFFLQALHA